MKLKFRIWDRQCKKFVANSSSLHCYSNWHIDAFTGEVVDFVAAIDGDRENFSKEPNPEYYADGVKVIKGPRYTVQQFTGLLDKNGREIYEGDIVYSSQSQMMKNTTPMSFSKGYSALVEYNPPSFILERINHICPIFWDGLEIIGNILENPELCEK